MKQPVRWTIDGEIISKIKIIAKKEDRSMSHIANRILKDGLKK